MKQASFLDTVKAVLCGFLGVRRRADHERVRLKPLHVVVTAVLFVALFVLALRTIVGLVVS
ncbi:MAG: DUF2970 domain-containing protein [Betaproteobacteria bacterium]